MVWQTYNTRSTKTGVAEATRAAKATRHTTPLQAPTQQATYGLQSSHENNRTPAAATIMLLLPLLLSLLLLLLSCFCITLTWCFLQLTLVSNCMYHLNASSQGALYCTAMYRPAPH
jgi:hypothetical protein